MTDVSADGQYLIYEGGDLGEDIGRLRLTGEKKAHPYVQGANIETSQSLPVMS